jgi:CHASE1-domain containing sensor protein
MAGRTSYERAADRAVEWLTARLDEDGSYGPDADDLACSTSRRICSRCPVGLGRLGAC